MPSRVLRQPNARAAGTPRGGSSRSSQAGFDTATTLPSDFSTSTGTKDEEPFGTTTSWLPPPNWPAGRIPASERGTG